MITVHRPRVRSSAWRIDRDEMNRFSTLLRRLIVPALAIAAWIAVYGLAFAQEAESEAASGGGGGGGAQSYVVPYTIVLLCIGLGVYLICRPARRRERPKGEQYEASSLIDFGKKEAVPVISLGMRMDQVTKLLGKPVIRRRGDELYREAAQAGKLSDEEAAKEYLTFVHPAGRYELVAFDRKVIEIKRQPKRKADDDAS
jgi:hypothetical protein